MKKLFTLIIIFAFSLSAIAQESIITIRGKSIGTTVTTSGIVLNGSELGSIRYIDDGTAGIGIYNNNGFAKINNLQPGDSITVTGKVSEYSNLLEITDVTSLVVESSNHQLPEPIILSIDEVDDVYEGRLIRINNASMQAGSNFSGSTNYPITVDGRTIEIRINKSAASIVGQPIPSSKFDLIAINSQFEDDYQLLPRTYNDFILKNSVNIISTIKVTNFTQNTLSLEWESDVAAKAMIGYGNADDNNIQFKKEGSYELIDGRHINKSELTGLTPGSIYYLQAISILDKDTAYSSIQPFGTISNSTGNIHAYFNTEVDHTYSTGGNAQNIGEAMEDTLAAYINRTKKTIDLCIYNIDNSFLISDVIKALNDAHRRGVKVRVISSGTTVHNGLKNLAKDIYTLESPEKTNFSIGLMHNKFAIFDANATDASLPFVWSGSTNLTQNQVNIDANNMIFIQDQTLAKAYQIEFEEMWGSNTKVPNESNAKFGAKKVNNTPHHFIIGGKKVESYFSPSDGTNQQIIDAMNSADFNLNISTMLITRTDLAYTIKDVLNKGVKVNILTDQQQNGNNYGKKVKEILQNLVNENHFVVDLSSVTGTLHHKYAIVDVDTDSDPIVITGSHNWSSSANSKNDENTLFIHDNTLANQYYQNFVARFKKNQGILSPVLENEKNDFLTVFPNPTKGKLTVDASISVEYISVYSLQGNKIADYRDINQLKTTVNLQSLPNGVYIIMVKTDNQEASLLKIIKQ